MAVQGICEATPNKEPLEDVCNLLPPSSQGNLKLSRNIAMASSICQVRGRSNKHIERTSMGSCPHPAEAARAAIASNELMAQRKHLGFCDGINPSSFKATQSRGTNTPNLAREKMQNLYVIKYSFFSRCALQYGSSSDYHPTGEPAAWPSRELSSSSRDCTCAIMLGLVCRNDPALHLQDYTLVQCSKNWFLRGCQRCCYPCSE